jgi:G3E family GTPase
MLSNIPANIITGFLGSGKTTAIRHLLAHKPSGERWAVLVNEFGETGIDGALLAADATHPDEVFIREVPGGCMCCATGVPMRVALNQLLARARPHRLLIEPTGLGHPHQLLKTLTGENFASVLDMRAVITLLDARKLYDSRYTEHRIFRQQLAIADRLVASKADLYTDQDRQGLEDFLQNDPELANKSLNLMEHGQLDAAWLDSASAQDSTATPAPTRMRNGDDEALGSGEEHLPASGIHQTHNEGEGFISSGWRFAPDRILDYDRLSTLLDELPVDRIKGVVHTEEGTFTFNREGETLDRAATDHPGESRLEFIARDPQALDGIEQRLQDCLLNNTSEPR